MFGIMLGIACLLSFGVLTQYFLVARSDRARANSYSQRYRRQPEAQPELPDRKSAKAFASAAGVLLCVGLGYYYMPVLALDFGGIWLLSFFALAVFGAIWAPSRAKWVVPILFVLYLVTKFLLSSPILHSERYYALLGAETEAQFSATLPPIDIEQAPLVSEDMAMRSMEKRLAEIPGLGSQVHVGRPVKQIVNGHLLWVSFLHHDSIVKWFLNATTPGYVTVSATNPSDVHLVQTLDGKPLALRYLSSASFGDNIQRRAYRAGLDNVGLMDFSPEIDDAGRPFYVVSLYAHKVGFSGNEVTGVATIDVQTGEVQRYSLAGMPRWIDRAQPEEIVEEQLSDRGMYVHGFWNPSDKDRLRVSGDVDLVYSHEGHAYWFAGLTSLSSDAGLVGFVLVDSRTKQVRHFKIAAVTEDVARSVAMNVNPEKRYTATNPLPFMVEGVPTYVMGLTDGQGVARAYGMVSMQNHQVMAVADTLAATVRLYEARLSTNKTQADIASAAQLTTIKATVRRVAAESRNNQTTYYLVLESDTDAELAKRIFTATSDVSEELVLTQRGDTVEVQVSATTTRIQAIAKFDNQAVGSP
jgi:hypothetical protein